MLRRALPSLFCAFALAAPAYSQDVFVPRELKAQPAHPAKEHKPEAKPEAPKEVMRRAEAATDASLKPAKDEAASKKTAKADTAKPAADKVAAKEKPASAKTRTPAEDGATIKIEKTATAKETGSTKKVAKAEPPKERKDKSASSKKEDDSDLPTIKIEKTATAKEPSSSKPVAKTETAPKEKNVPKADGAKVEAVTAKTEKPAVKDHPATVAASKTLKSDRVLPKEETKASKTESAKPEVVIARTEKPAAIKEKEKPAVKAPPTKNEAFAARNEPAPVAEGPPTRAVAAKSDLVSVPSKKDPSQMIPATNSSFDTGFTRIADGFDFPVGKPEAEGYYKARGFRAGGHVGEDWDGVRGGDTDLGDPIYCIGDGVVVFARDVHLGWGNVVIVRHAYREGGNVKYIDSLYGHLQKMLVGHGQRVSRGQQIATMGTAHGQYDAHLHFEIRKNLEIGMSRSKFQKDFSNYYDPTQFLNAHRRLSGGGANYKVAMNTFTYDWMYHFDKNRDFGSRKRSTGESSAALRRALTSAH
jgi:murein DD-endopeptidase MepM/ murein hydrolase activator NlpD